MSRNVSLELISITELLILMDSALKFNKNIWYFEASDIVSENVLLQL